MLNNLQLISNVRCAERHMIISKWKTIFIQSNMHGMLKFFIN